MTKTAERLVDATALLALSKELFRAAGAPDDEATLVADTLVTADLRGMQSHGVLRIPVYISKIKGGGFCVGQKGHLLRETPATVLIDGGNGLGAVIALRAMDEAIRKARQTGIGAAGVTNSNHYGEAAYYVRHAIRQDMIGVIATNGSPNMPAWGGKTKMTGPLPFTAGVPTLGEQPFLIDAALGMTNRGKLIYYAEKGEKIPRGWGVDRDAQDTDDPARVLDGGWILPIGGHKGFGITLFLEILSGILTGGPFGAEIGDLYSTGPSAPQGLGHFAIAIDPAAFMDVRIFKERMDAMIRAIKASELAPGVPRMTVPGEPEFELEARRRREGIPLIVGVLDQLNQLAASMGVERRL